MSDRTKLNDDLYEAFMADIVRHPAAGRTTTMARLAQGRADIAERVVNDFLASAELRGAQRQREADVKALRDEAARNVSRDDVFYKLALQYAADHLVLAPLAASPEETQP